MKCFLDIDGVIADFNEAAAAIHGRLCPYRTGGIVGDENWDLVKVLEMEPQKFWKPLGYEFWRNLKKTKESDDVIGYLKTRFKPDEMCFLTSPCLTSGCMEGKRDWCHEHYPDIPILFSQSAVKEPPPKWMCAKGNVLIDDHSVNVRLWEVHEGKAFLFPRPWNGAHNLEKHAVEMMMDYVDRFCYKWALL